MNQNFLSILNSIVLINGDTSVKKFIYLIPSVNRNYIIVFVVVFYNFLKASIVVEPTNLDSSLLSINVIKVGTFITLCLVADSKSSDMSMIFIFNPSTR